MKIALQGTTLLIKEADNVQFAVIKSWNKMRWDRKTQLLTGTADMELLDKLASIVQLPPAIAQRRSQLHRVQEAIDSERVNPHPKPLADYPVKMSLYDHQVRGANMCLVAFGWASPDEIERRNGSHALSQFQHWRQGGTHTRHETPCNAPGEIWDWRGCRRGKLGHCGRPLERL